MWKGVTIFAKGSAAEREKAKAVELKLEDLIPSTPARQETASAAVSDEKEEDKSIMRRNGKSSLKRAQRRLELRFAEAVEQVTKAPEWYDPP